MELTEEEIMQNLLSVEQVKELEKIRFVWIVSEKKTAGERKSLLIKWTPEPGIETQKELKEATVSGKIKLIPVPQDNWRALFKYETLESAGKKAVLRCLKEKCSPTEENVVGYMNNLDMSYDYLS